MPKIILLDVDNTLLDFHRCAVAAMTEVYGAFGVTCTPEMAEIFFPINEGFWKRLERKEITKDELYVHRWKLIFSKLGLTLDAALFEERFLNTLATAAVPMEGAVEMLRALKTDYTLCVASNASHDQQCKRLEKAGMLRLLREVFTSEQLGAAKPSREFFGAALARLGDPKPEDVLMLGDSLTADMQGALDVGIRTCWFNPNGEETALPLDFVVADLRDVPQVLKEGF